MTRKRKIVMVLLIVPAVLMIALGTIVWFLEETFKIGYTHYKEQGK